MSIYWCNMAVRIPASRARQYFCWPHILYTLYNTQYNILVWLLGWFFYPKKILVWLLGCGVFSQNILGCLLVWNKILVWLLGCFYFPINIVLVIVFFPSKKILVLLLCCSLSSYKILFCILVNNRNDFQTSNLWTCKAFCLWGQKAYFLAEN